MSWKYDEIAAQKVEKVSARYGNADRSELLARIAELETMIHPLWVALSPITENSWRGTVATSHLWPLRADDDNMAVFYNEETSKCENVPIVEADLTKYVDYESVNIDKGDELPDNFEIIAFHQQAPGCYVGNGAVFVGDIRRLIEVVNAPYRTALRDAGGGE